MITKSFSFSLSSFFFFLLISILPLSSSSYPFDKAFHIDCGGSTETKDKFNTTWIADRFFSAGAASLVSEPLRFHNLHEKTVRYFPIKYGKKNCYTIPNLPFGSRFYIRTFTVYDSYDGKSHSPSLEVSVEGTLFFSWRPPWSVAALQYVFNQRI